MFNCFLKQDTQTDSFADKRLDFMFNQIRITSFSILLAAVVMLYLLTGSVYFDAVLIWFFIVVISTLFRQFVVFKKINYLRLKGEKRYDLYYAVIIVFIFLSGLLWGVCTYLFMPDIENVERFITFSLCIVVIAGGSSNLAVSRTGSLLFLLPIAIAFIVKMYELELYTLFLVAVSFYLYLFLTEIRLNKVITHSILGEIENERLVGSVTVEKEIAEQANIEKSHFLAAASHDLRQPLNSMGLFLYALRQRIKSFDDRKLITLLGQIEDSFLALKNLFDSLLEISHLDAGTINTANKNFKTSFILQPLIDDMTELAGEKQLDISYQSSECYLYTDPVLLLRIMRNLISNAIKYTNEGKIDVIEVDDGRFITIKVMDTGIGIPEHEFENIFNEYYQLANKARDRRQGIGLGLSLVKKMCAVIGAEISVESTLNKGSVFTLRLPTADKVDTEAIKPEFNNRPIKRTQVLVIDDEPEALQAMSLLLDDWQCLVEAAETYQQAVASIARKVPDIILSDYRLQENITGTEVVWNLRKVLNRDIPAIIITGDTDTSVLKKIQKEGFLMLSKPINPKELQNKIGLLTSGK